MKNYINGLPAGLPLAFNYGRGDPSVGINSSEKTPCGVLGRFCMIWLTCRNSVCQDFLFLNVGLSF